MAKNSVNPADEGVLSVRTIDSEGKAPKRRVSTVTAAWSSYSEALNGNQRRDQRFGDIQGIYNGFPPTPPSVLERNGQADMPNINTKQFQAKVDTYCSTWNAISAQGEGWIDIIAEHDDPMEAERRSKVLTEESNRAIKQWDSVDEDELEFENGSQFVLESSARDKQMALFGIGIAFFPDNIDFRFRMIPTRNVLLPDQTRICLDNCPVVFIKDQLSVVDLYDKADLPGWNRNAILRQLYDHVELRSATSQTGPSYAEWVNQIRDNQTWLLTPFLPVRLIHMFVKEFDGSITHSIFTEQNSTGGDAKKDARNGNNKDYVDAGQRFIFDKLKAAKRWKQVMIPFADNAGPECDYHGVKGFGDLIFDGCHLNNLMFNRAARGAVMRNMLMFKGLGENDVQKMDQLTFTEFGIMAPGLEMEQMRFEADVEAAVSIVQVGTQIIDSNTRIFPQNDKTAGGEQPTATQVNFDRADQAQFSTLQIALYRAIGLDPQFSEMYRRLAQPQSKYPESWAGGRVAKSFRKRCARRGIPESELLKVKTVRANRNIGSGNMGLDLMKAKELLAIATPGKGQWNARYEVACALKGVEMAKAFVEPEPEPGPADQEIAVEQNIIQLGQIPTAFGWQDQEKHVGAHMQLLAEGAQVAGQVQEAGIGPQNLEGAKKLNNFLAAGIQHVGQHLQLMSEVRRNGKQPALHEQFIKETAKQLNNLQQISESLGEDIAKVDQATQPQMSPEMMETQAKIQRDDMLAQASMVRDDAKAKAKLGNQAVQVEARTQMKVEDHQLKVATAAEAEEFKRAETAAKAAQEMTIRAKEAEQERAIAAKAAEERIAQEKQKAAAKPKPKTPKTK